MDRAVVLGLYFWYFEHLRRRTTDVERTHGQLCAGFADGLRRNDADGFAEFHTPAGGEVAPVAMDADAVLAFASEHGANADAVNAGRFNGLGLGLVNLFVGFDEIFLRVIRVGDVFAREAADETVSELHDLVFTFLYPAHPNTVGGAAIFFLDDDALRHVHELAGHIPESAVLRAV